MVQEWINEIALEAGQPVGGSTDLTTSMTVQLLMLPAPVLAVVVGNKAKGLTLFLQRGLSRGTTAAVIAEVLAEIEEG